MSHCTREIFGKLASQKPREELDRPQTNPIHPNLYIACHYPKRPKTIRAAFSTAKQHNPFYLQKLQSTFSAKLSTNGPLTGGPTQKWNQCKYIVKKTAKTVLGLKKCTPQDWFDEIDSVIEGLLARKYKAFMDYQN